MLSKIILTLLVIVGCLWFVSSKRGQHRQQLLVIGSKKDRQRRAALLRGAYLFMFIMVLAASTMIYIELSDNYKTVTIHVINTQTGAKSSYQARREDVGARSFTTVNGRKVYVAGIERIEVEAAAEAD
ncbi:hypothetical protein MnTg03_00668 [bacterium MnTg03]|nr:hypothetical protein MnTg03_00668 [bacterium MnTg03]